jgi:cold shock CspA family protein
MTGKVKAANSRGFGFIETSSGIDFFFHYSELRGITWKQLLTKFVNNEEIFVEFDNNPVAKNGPQALNVRIRIENRVNGETI